MAQTHVADPCDAIITVQPSSVVCPEASSLTTDTNTQEKVVYENVYRTGNFGVMLGKINLRRAKKWTNTHLLCSIVIFLLAITGHILLDAYYPKNFRRVIISLIWTSALLGICSAGLATYFFRHIHNLSRPYAVYMSMRFLITINWVFVCFGVIFAGITPTIVSTDWAGTNSALAATKAVYWMLFLLMLIELVVSFSLVSGPNCSAVCNECSCCGACCVYEEGEMIAPGVANPPSQEKMIKVAEIAMAINDVVQHTNEKVQENFAHN